VFECGACNGDGIGEVDGLFAQGGMNEVFLSWGANDCADSYNIYDGGELVGSSPGLGFVHDDNGSGFGLGWYETHCYTVTAVAADGTESAASGEMCATTLPYVTAGLQLDTSMADQGIVNVIMVNFLPVGGYQFNASVSGADLVAAVDGSGLLTAQVGGNGNVIGFSLEGNVIPPAPGGQLLASLVLSHSASSAVSVSLSDFVFAGMYNGEVVDMYVCDTDFTIVHTCKYKVTQAYGNSTTC
jgi:hypothetical protein